MLKWLWVSILVIFSDQLTKWIAEASLEMKKYPMIKDGVQVMKDGVAQYIDVGIPYPVIPHLNMTLSYNYGAAFSSFSGYRWGLAILAIIVSFFILQWIRKLKEDEIWTAIGLCLVLGGAIGNLADRLLNGRVIDFIDAYWTETGYHFATFNVADIAITMGAALLVFISLFSKGDEENS